MAILKIKDANGVWQNVHSIKGDKGERGERGPEGPRGPAGGVVSVNGVTPDASGNVSVQVGSDYTLPQATSSTLGGVKIGNNITVSSGTISLTSTNVTNALGYTPAQNVPTVTLSSLGVTATAAELNYVDGVTSNIQTQLNAKAALASPTFTGTPKAPTAAVGTNTTQLATTAFVTTAVANKTSVANATNATKATQDASGNVITSTYATKTELTNGLAEKSDISHTHSYLPLGGGNMTGTITFGSDKGVGIKWGTRTNNGGVEQNPYIGYCTGSGDGTFVVGSLLGTTYQSGLAIGGSSGNLLWKGARILDSNNFSEFALSKSGTAAKATADASGNNIANTYATKASLASVATSGSYNDLANKPTIPSAYKLPSATSSVLGGVKVGSNITVKSGTISLSKSNVTSALGYTPIPLSGSRGNLAGYNTPTVTSSAITINGSSSDDIQVTGAVAITVSNGSSSTSWCKAVSITNASASVTLGSKWKWANGEAPTVSANCVLLLYWNNSFGLANIIATTA